MKQTHLPPHISTHGPTDPFLPCLLTCPPTCLPFVLLQFCTPIAAAWLVGGGKVTPIALLDDNPYSSQPKSEDEDDEDADPTVVGGAAQSSVYLGKTVQTDTRPLLYFNAKLS